MKGISPVIATVLLISLTVIISLSAYYWSAGQTIKAPKQTEPYEIDAVILDSNIGSVRITNADTETIPETIFTSSESTSGCASPELQSGQSIVCVFGNWSGQATIYAKETQDVVLVAP